MKKIIFPLLLSMIVFAGYTQKPCSEYTLNQQEQAIVRQYVMSCIRDHWFVNSKGIVEIRRFVNEKGEKCWYMMAVIDDSYKDNPPTEYAWCTADLVFFYDSIKPNSFAKKQTTPTPELLACLEEVTYDKLYIRPPAKRQYTTIFGKQILHMRHCLGNCANDLIVTFHERGDYTKSIVP
jgi:hypothetical protein